MLRARGSRLVKRSPSIAMSQETKVFEVDPDRALALRRSLSTGEFVFRQIPHATWAVQGFGVVATCYRSGKLVIQGAPSDVEAFTTRFLALAEPKVARRAERDDDLTFPSESSVIGADEAGKGDYFGPLVVAAVHVNEERRVAMETAGAIRDSKLLSTTRIFQVAGVIERELESRVLALPPEEYNDRYERRSNLNELLADLHAENLTALSSTHPPDIVLVDQFSRSSYLGRCLHGRSYRLVEVPRAERHVAVAAASILARAHYLEALKVLSETYGVSLRPGSGAPTRDQARELVRREGPDVLRRVAKLHFKLTDELLEGLTDS